MEHRKTALITGASRGIGKGIAIAFAKAGYDLALCCHTRIDLLENMCDIFEEKYDTCCIVRALDVSDHEAVGAFVEETRRQFGHIDVLVNNAGISRIGLFSDMKPAEWQEILGTNLTSVYNFCHQIIPDMVHVKSGHIINISSVWGCCGASCEVAYSATKGAVNALTQALAKELAPSGISVNAVACGTIDTEMNQCFSDEERQALCDEIPAGRFGNTEEVGEFVLQIAESSTYLTGQIIRFDGGWI